VEVVRGASHLWTLEYSRRAQTFSTGDKLPDFILRKGDDAVLAIEYAAKSISRFGAGINSHHKEMCLPELLAAYERNKTK
jgi:hypothetical protein